MKYGQLHLTISISLICFSILSGARADDDWVDILDPVEVTNVISGMALDGGKLWQDYYRTDGNVAVIHFPDRNISVRKWTVQDDGMMCHAIFVKPDRVLNCMRIQKTRQDPPRFRFREPTGTYEFGFMKSVPDYLEEAVNEKAGPLQPVK